MHCISNTIVIYFATLPYCLFFERIALLLNAFHFVSHNLCSLVLKLHSSFLLPFPSPLPFGHLQLIPLTRGCSAQPHPCQDLSLLQWQLLSLLLSHSSSSSSSVSSSLKQSAVQVSTIFLNLSLIIKLLPLGELLTSIMLFH